MKKIKERFNDAEFIVRKFRSNCKELCAYFETLKNVNIANNSVHKKVVDSKIINKQKLLSSLWEVFEDIFKMIFFKMQPLLQQKQTF